MGTISWIVIGFIAGTLAKLMLPGRGRLGCLLTTLLGMGGVLVGSYIGALVGWGRVTGFNLLSLGLAVLGSAMLLILFRILFGRPR